MYLFAHYQLKQRNTMGVSCTARYFAEIKHASAIPILRKDPKLSALPWRVMGGGSNLLLTQDLDALVISCSYSDIQLVQEDAHSVWLSVGAGCSWHHLVSYTVKQGWWGLENLALIPGKVGAAPVQNIGAYGAEVQDTITRIQAFDLRDGQRIELRKNECQFAYRDSIFKHELADRLLIHRVTFRLRKHSSPNLVHEPLHEAIVQQYPNLKIEDMNSQMICDAVIKLRQERIPDPDVLGSAGSFFKNPVISLKHFQQLQQTYPDIPGHKLVNGQIKVPAAWLIEKAQWKGRRIDDAGTYYKHALILVNYGKATGKDILNLADAICQDVIARFAISLEKEVVVW